MLFRTGYCNVMAAMVLALAGGCASTDFGGEVLVSPEAGGGPPAVGALGTSLSLPADRPFNIHLKNSGQNPGVSGAARGDSDADGTGRAFCLAEAASGASATAEFRVGQRIFHQADTPQRLAASLEFELQHAIHASPQPLADTRTAVTVQFVIVDARKRLVARSMLVQLSSDDTQGSATEGHVRQLSAPLEPNQSYDIMMHAKVESSAGAGQEAAARLDLRNLKMRLAFQPAATQPAGARGDTKPAG